MTVFPLNSTDIRRAVFSGSTCSCVVEDASSVDDISDNGADVGCPDVEEGAVPEGEEPGVDVTGSGAPVPQAEREKAITPKSIA